MIIEVWRERGKVFFFQVGFYILQNSVVGDREDWRELAIWDWW